MPPSLSGAPGKPSGGILGVIPARGGSKGLPGKNIRSLGGVPLIQHTIRAARESVVLSDFIVSTDDPLIADTARACGARVPFMRPAALAGDESPIWPVVRHAVAYWENETGSRLEAVALLQPTSPLRIGLDIDACVERFRELKADMCVTVTVSHDSPYFNMVEILPESFPFSRPCTPFMRQNDRRQNVPRVYSLNGAVYVVARAALDLLVNQFNLDRFAVSEMPKCRSVDVDEAEDLALAEFWQSRKGLL